MEKLSEIQTLTANETTVTDQPLGPSGSSTRGTFTSRLRKARTAMPVMASPPGVTPVPRAPPPCGSRGPRVCLRELEEGES